MATKRKVYRPREYGICSRCGEKRGVTQLHKAFGCLRCKEKLTPEQQKALHDALIEKNREKRAIQNGLQESQEARQHVIESRAGERAPEYIERLQKTQEKAAVEEGNMALVHQLVAEADFIAKVDQAFGPAAALPRCACCFTPWHAGQPQYVETWDGKLLCQLCAFGVLRCGACPVHNNVLYPEIAATVPRTQAHEYPPEVLAGYPPGLIGN